MRSATPRATTFDKGLMQAHPTSTAEIGLSCIECLCSFRNSGATATSFPLFEFVITLELKGHR